jgi:RHS repeat-associated protein
MDNSESTTYIYDAADELEHAVTTFTSSTQVHVTTYTYDENGNLVLEMQDTGAPVTRTTHTWDDENRLVQVEKTGMTTNAYSFNADGQRVRIVDSQSPSGRRLIWDEENILLETSDAGSTEAVYTYEPAGYGKLVSQRRGSTSGLFLFDALGSARQVVNNPANMFLAQYSFRPFGEVLTSSGSLVNPFRWVGEVGYYYDVDRLAHYVRASTYNPKIARWLSRDPLGFAAGDVNIYRYVANRTILVVDSTGLTYGAGPFIFDPPIGSWQPCSPNDSMTHITYRTPQTVEFNVRSNETGPCCVFGDNGVSPGAYRCHLRVTHRYTGLSVFFYKCNQGLWNLTQVAISLSGGGIQSKSQLVCRCGPPLPDPQIG